ncbi:glycosidase, family 5 domain protein [Wolbachia endosymbiont of Trichogramma pretiosum]|nr:glycosidase, family 5 domain protein [Wolbachia endosymbiont of Trichogramma pretiosum]
MNIIGILLFMAFEKIYGMDYELGSKKLSWKDWQAIEEGRMKKKLFAK